ncbi:hypothetical protein ACPEEZ_01445 [Frigoribacterium sp. 2-23]|uniref:hypothetical protein n=1 Tax=Frigoribacterium sp. 2-23 TaxID=3415006 RepID=UPI003C6FFBB9
MSRERLSVVTASAVRVGAAVVLAAGTVVGLAACGGPEDDPVVTVSPSITPTPTPETPTPVTTDTPSDTPSPKFSPPFKTIPPQN